MNRRANVWVWGLIAFVFVGAVIAALAARPFSIRTIGEEGYEPYDPLLSANSFDPAKWIITTPSCNGLSGDRAANCQNSVANNGLGVSARDGKLVHSAIPYAANNDQPVLRTADLRLIDFKTEFQLFAGGADGGTVCWYTACYTADGGREDRRSRSGIGTLELRWDDYELGHYQLFVNEQLVEEGNVPEGTPFSLTSTPTSDYGSEWWLRGELTLMNPRVKRLFGCDLQAGEVKVHTCHNGPDSITVNDLKGFQRFCPSLPATFTDAGISTASKRVYYNLAQGESVNLGKNQIWEFHYLADSKTMNAPPDKTGTVELCKGTLLIEDLKDLPVEQPAISGGVLRWTSYGRYDGTAGYKSKKTDLMSGNVAFMMTSPIKIDETTCPYTEDSQVFPGLPSSCFSIDSFGKSFGVGDTITITNGLNVTLENLIIRYRRDDAAGKTFAWTARWRLSFSPDAVSASLPVLPTAERGAPLSVNLGLASNLPGPATVLSSVGVVRTVVGERDETLINTSIKKAGSAEASVSLPTTTIGQHEVTITPSLQTEYGGIVFSSTTTAYNVTADATTTSNPATSIPWWSRLWEWLRGLFAY